MDEKEPKKASKSENTNGLSTDTLPQTMQGDLEKGGLVPRAELLRRAKESSHSSGVYLMKDSQKTVLYVGKAKVLRNRLTS